MQSIFFLIMLTRDSPTTMSRSKHHRFMSVILFYIVFTLTLQDFSKADIIFISKEKKTEAIFENTELPFGKLAYLGLRGKMIMAEPDEYGCSPIISPPLNNNDMKEKDNWIVLMRRSSCSFEVKVKIAMMANYQAVIIQNNQDYLMKTNELDTIVHPINEANRISHLDLQIPVLMVSYLDGFLIKEHYIRGAYSVILTPRNEGLPINAYFFPFATMFAVCLFIVGTFMIIKFSGTNRRRKRRRLSTRDLKQLDTLRYSMDSCYKYEICAICIEEYRDGDQLRVLPCHHAYHAKCIDPWLTGSRCVCPICNARVKYSSSDLDSDYSSSGYNARTNRGVNASNHSYSPSRTLQSGNINYSNGLSASRENTPLLQGRPGSSSLLPIQQNNIIISSSPSSDTQRYVIPKAI